MEIKIRQTGKIDTEGDTLSYKVTGEGKPLLLIAGGGGDGDLYLPLADKLANYFMVITYDRRANATSTMNFPNNFDIAQQARDAHAVLKATGVNDAVIFGNSSGAIIAVELLRLFPENVVGIIVHEPPIARLHPESEKWRKFFKDCYDSAFKFGGASMAATKFLFGIEVPAINMIGSQIKAMRYLKNEPKNPTSTRIPSKIASEYLIKQELIKVTDYAPDLEYLKSNKDKVVIAVGTYAQRNNTFLFKVAKRLSEILEKPFTIVSGHHGSFMDEVQAWGDSIKAMATELYANQ